MSAQQAIDRLARTEGILAVSAIATADLPVTGEAPFRTPDRCAFGGVTGLQALLLASINLWKEGCHNGLPAAEEVDDKKRSNPDLQVTLEGTAHSIVVERENEVVIAVVSIHGHPVRKSLRRSLRRCLRSLTPAGVRHAAQEGPSAERAPISVVVSWNDEDADDGTRN